MAFARKTKAVTIDGQELVVTELTASKARQIGSLDDGWEATKQAFIEMIRKPDGTAFFASKDEIDELPTSIVEALTVEIQQLNAPKN